MDNYDFCIVKLLSNLTILNQKVCGSAHTEIAYSVVICDQNNICVVGYNYLIGQDCLILKLSKDLASGTSLIMTSPNITLTDSNLTFTSVVNKISVAYSNLTYTVSNIIQ